MKLRHPRARGFWLYYPNDQEGGHQALRVYTRDAYDFAVVVWKTCGICRHGVISKISIIDDWHRQGIGRRLIRQALDGCADYTWTTSGQSTLAKQFFPAMTEETGAAFTPLAPVCPHIRSGRPGSAAPRLLTGG
ncbi:hypothetical protein [Streptomyces canus]|uniref:hypothetical protein n=1 Tax=Streptomyces canus TaxID=58343 RepID=UPI0027D7E88A|nr:hypothetical protein [Streptomyces canus]